ncbi:unnamed protein product [Alternaria alternata]
MLRDLIKTKDWSAEEEEEEEEEEEDSEKEEDQPRDSYHPWGYTIYRTCYTPESQSRWESLIEAILLGVEGTIPGLRKDETPPRSQLLLSLSPRSSLRRLLRFPDTEQQRLRYFGNTYKEWSETKKQWLKCVKVDYVYAEYEQRSRHDRLPFLGWFMTTTGSIAELWETLAGGDILRIDSKVEGVTCK